MIDYIELKNFEGHKNTRLDFVPGVNVITGTTGHGKSSIMKALDWNFNNKPAGDPFVSTFKKPKELCVVNVGTTDGTIGREKNKTHNQYIINNNHKNPLKALRSDVPEQVQEISKIKPINIQKQIEQFFLLDKSPGKVAKEFNQVAGLGTMDKALTIAKSEVTNIETKIKINKSSIKETKKKIEELSWVDQAEKDLCLVEKMKTDIEEINEKYEKTDNVLLNILSIDEDLSWLKNVKKAEIDLKDIFKYISKNKVCKLYIGDIQEITTKIKENKKHVTLDTETIESCLLEISSLIKDKQDIKYRVDNINRTLSSSVLNDCNRKRYKYINQSQKRLKQILTRIKSKGEVVSKISEIKNTLESIKMNKKMNSPIKKQINEIRKQQEIFKKEIKICPTCGQKF